MPHPFYFFQQLSSTNQWALERAQNTPFFCVACQQSSGRGRRENTWQSHQGDLLLSYASILECVPSNLSVHCGLKIAEFFTDIGVNIKVKWPNDLMLSSDELSIKEAKVGGILIEAKPVFENNLGDRAGNSKVVVGVGINTSSAHIAHIPMSDISYQQLLLAISNAIVEAVHQEAFNIDFRRWQQYDYLLNQEIMFSLPHALADAPAAISIAPIPTAEPLDNSSPPSTYRYRMVAKGVNHLGELIVYDPQSNYQQTLNHAFSICKAV